MRRFAGTLPAAGELTAVPTVMPRYSVVPRKATKNPIYGAFFSAKGRIEDALALGKQNLLACVGFGSLQGIVQSLSQRRYFRRAPREADAAAPLLSCFEAQREQIGVSEAWVARINEQTLAAIRARLDESAFAEAWEQGRALTIDEAVALALESLE